MRKKNAQEAHAQDGSSDDPEWFRGTPEDFLRIARENTSARDFLEIWRMAIEDSISGDKYARDFVGKMLLPDKPGNLSSTESKALTVEFFLDTRQEGPCPEE